MPATRESTRSGGVTKLQEVVEHLVINRPEFTEESADRLVALLNSAFPDAPVDISRVAQRRVVALALPDEGDRHVWRAAVAADADVVCTDNIKHFPERVMTQLGVDAMTADSLPAQVIRNR